MRDAGIRYSPTDAIEPFATPHACASARAFGAQYEQHRRLISKKFTVGLTKIYNRFHEPEEKAAEIAKLRDLHVGMDHAVAGAYGWDHLNLGHGFHETDQGIRFSVSPPARREVLDRLLELNHERYAEEVAQGPHEKNPKVRGNARAIAAPDAQPGLFGAAVELDAGSRSNRKPRK